MNYAEIRTRVIERMAEYTAGAAEATTSSTIAPQTIYNRMASVIRTMRDFIKRKDPEKLLTSTTMTYTANSESLALPAAVQNQAIRTVERQVNTAAPIRYDPLRDLTLDQLQQALRWGELPILDEDAPWSGFGYYIEGQTTIYVAPMPASDYTLRIRYSAAFANLTDATDDANAPNFIHEDHHEYIALETALRFLRETGSPASLERERLELKAAFEEWAATSPKQGPRKVREV